MADDQHDYKVGPGRPPLHTRFRKGQSGNPGGRSKKKLHALPADALNEPAFVTIDGERRKITKREAPAGLHELKRRCETPLPLIETFDALLSLAHGLSAKQKRKQSDEIMATALKRSERKDVRSQPEAGGGAGEPISH
jgi:hypothetical protein